MDHELLARAKADPEAFRRETVEALRDAGFNMRARGVAGELPNRTIESALLLPWIFLGISHLPPEKLTAHDHNDALLQALTEMTPAEREKLGW